MTYNVSNGTLNSTGKGGATIVIGGTMSLPILMSAEDKGVQNY